MPSNAHFYSAAAVLWLVLAILGNDATDQTKAGICGLFKAREEGWSKGDQLQRGSATVIGDQSIKSRILLSFIHWLPTM